MSEFTADILIVIFVLYFISYLLILKELSYKNALKNENIELDTLIGYFHLADMKRLLMETDSWLRRRIRMCIWKAWKLPKTRIKNLIRCGINKHDAKRWGYVKGYWRVSGSPIMHLAASSQKLHQAGYPTLMGSYLEWRPK